MHSMKRLYSAGTALEAHDLRLFLAAHGIEAKVFGDNNAWEGAFAFTPDSAPGVFVVEADLALARDVLDEFIGEARLRKIDGQWTCPNCSESVGAQFDTCWNCETPRGVVPIDSAIEAIGDEDGDESLEEHAEPARTRFASSPLRGRWALWWEVVIVFSLVAPMYGRSVPVRVVHALGLPGISSTFYLGSVLANVLTAVVVLCVIRLGREPWSNFGIIKPDSRDLVTASIICITDYFLNSMGLSILFDIVRSMYGEQHAFRLWQAHRHYYHAQGLQGFFALLALAISVGISEELLARSYLIPRLERILRRTWAAVLISAIVFGLLHWQRGVFSVWSAFLMGLVYGVAFAWSRRLWPVAMAHAVYDFSAFLYFAR
jgi:membrane protease YdiL (CAAX protease family)